MKDTKELRKKGILAALLVVWAAVAVWAWSSFQPRSPVAAVAALDTSEIAYFLEEGGPMKLHLDWLDREQPVGSPLRDLFSTAPISAAVPTEGTPDAADVAATTAPPQPPPIAAELRYMGYVETAAGTLALLREGSQMYLAGEGSRVGHGYLVAIVNEMFVEIEFKGTRRRLPVSGQESGTNGR